MIFQNLVCGTPQDNLHELNIIPGKHIFTYSTYVFRHTVISWNIVIRFDSGVLILVFNPLFPHKSKTEGRKDCRLIFVTHPKKTHRSQKEIKMKIYTYSTFQSQSFPSGESPANTGQICPILKWQSTLAKWCHVDCHVSLCEAVGLFLISAVARSWWGQTTFPSHLERNNGARNCAGSQTDTAPRATLNQECQLVFVLFFSHF